MNLRPETPQSSTLRVLQSLLHAHGLDLDNFELEEHPSLGLGGVLGAAGAILSVRCRATGEERLYATGTDSAWIGAFMMDLGSGHFGKLPRARAVAGPPLRAGDAPARPAMDNPASLGE